MTYAYSVIIEPTFLGLAPFFAAALFLWSKRETIVQDGAEVGRFRPLIALYMDLFFIVLVCAPLFLIPLGLEYLATGKWKWSVKRDFPRPTDIVLVLEIFVIFVALHFYLRWAQKQKRQTVGQYFMRFQLNDQTVRIGLIRYLGWALALILPNQYIILPNQYKSENIMVQKVTPVRKFG